MSMFVDWLEYSGLLVFNCSLAKCKQVRSEYVGEEEKGNCRYQSIHENGGKWCDQMSE